MTTAHPSHSHVVRVPSRSPLLLGAFLLLALPLVAAGQYPQTSPPPGANEEQPAYTSDEVPAHLAVVDGTATLERDGSVEDAVENLPLLAGDRLRTSRGRVEVLFNDGSAVDVDEYSDVDLLSDSLMRLLAGRVRVSMARTSLNARGDTIEYRVDTMAGSVLIHSAGDYRVALFTNTREPQVDLAVWRGTAELQNALGRTLVRAGTRAVAAAQTAPSLPYGFNSAAWDAFDSWAQDQRDARFGVDSSRYLPADLRYYGGAFDRYGAWAYEPTYGQVWYPRVDVGWRPYYSGRWSFFARFGWFWIGADRWSWPTHHYGRWGLSAANRWFWVPDRRWAPAWVSWGYAPGYVSWCPLGINGYPVVSLVSVQYSRGWSVLPTRLFTHNVFVPRHVVDGGGFGPSLRSAAVVRNTAPVWRDTGRAAAPLRGPGASRLGPSGAESSRFDGTRSDPARSYGGRPGGVDTGRAVPRAVPGSAAPGVRGESMRGGAANAPGAFRSTPDQNYRRAPDARIEGSRAQPRGWRSPSVDMGSRPIQRTPQQMAPSGPTPDPRMSMPQGFPRGYGRVMPPQESAPGRDAPRAVPRSREQSDVPRFRPPSGQGAPPPPRAARPDRPRPNDGGGSGRAVPRGRGGH